MLGSREGRPLSYIVRPLEGVPVLVRFTAKKVFLGEDDFCTSVTFDTTRREYLNLQRAHQPVPDEETGETAPDEEVYLERRGQGWAARGGVVLCRLSRELLRVQVTEATARQLGGASEFEIRFKVGGVKYARLRELMREVFRGEAAYQEAEAEPGAAADGGA
jgi:hypothetical protein